MRIALDATYSTDPQPSGIAVYSQEILNGLARAYPDDRFVHCYRPKQFLRSKKPDLKNVSRSLLLGGVRTFSPDIFHALNQRVDKRLSPKIVATFHDLFVMTGEYSTEEFRARFSKQAKEAAERSDLIIAISEFTAEQVTSLLKVERQRIRVVPHGVHQPIKDLAHKREKMVLFVGALQVRKNLARLVEAFEAMSEAWKLVLAGAETGYRAEEILERIEASPCRDRIEVTGYVSSRKLAALFRQASIFAFPSLDEGFGMPVLEAMARSVPVITSNGSALASLGKGAALLVDPYRVDEIANALNDLAGDTALQEELIRAGKQRAAEFSWEETVRRTYAVYSELK